MGGFTESSSPSSQDSVRGYEEEGMVMVCHRDVSTASSIVSARVFNALRIIQGEVFIPWSCTDAKVTIFV
jgi:hypothetical protein